MSSGGSDADDSFEERKSGPRKPDPSQRSHASTTILDIVMDEANPLPPVVSVRPMSPSPCSLTCVTVKLEVESGSGAQKPFRRHAPHPSTCIHASSPPRKLLPSAASIVVDYSVDRLPAFHVLGQLLRRLHHAPRHPGVA